jgi:DNA invertase Pin-like site-specific DNA recombinase
MCHDLSTPQRAVIYLRISLDRTGESQAVERQEKDARKLARARDWQVIETITDNSISAAGKAEREGFERLLELIGSGEVQVVVAWALDRLTRNRRDTVRLIETCQQHDATIALVRGSDMDMSTPAGRMVADILASVARAEIEIKSDRQTRAAQQAAEKGRHIKARRPFGWEADGLTIQPREAAAIRQAYQLILDGGSLNQIARDWNAAGLLPPQGKLHPKEIRAEIKQMKPQDRPPRLPSAWTGATVSRTLRLPRMAGLRAYHKGVQEIDGEPVKLLGKDGQPVEPIIDRDTWQEAQLVMTNPARRPERRFDQMLLTGLAECGLCDAGIHSGGKRRSEDQRYRCAAGRGHVNRKAKPVEDWVVQAILDRLKRPGAAELFAPDPTVSQAKAKVQQELRRAQQRYDRLPALYAEGTITEDDLRAQRGNLRTKIAKLQAQLPSDRRPRALRAVVTAEDIEAAWDALTTEAQRDIIDALATVTLYPPGPGVTKVKPEHVVIKWK